MANFIQNTFNLKDNTEYIIINLESNVSGTKNQQDNDKSEKLRESIIKFFDVIDDNTIISRKKLVDAISISINYYDSRKIWNTIKEMVEWKDSKTPFVINNKRFLIEYM